MLFSNVQVAEFINTSFEPVWVSVRPAPQVTIDFGNGTTVRRTLQGNVATYVCAATGTVIDVLPGIYDATSYLTQLKSLHQTASAKPDRDGLKAYHIESWTRLQLNPPTPRMEAIANTGGGMKGGIGGITANNSIQGGIAGAGIEGPTQSVIAGLPLASQPGLLFDSQVNEQVRRRKVHGYLMAVGPVRPEAMKAWLFRDVLKADLDDPHLGLGKLLTQNYPFAEEDVKLGNRQK